MHNLSQNVKRIFQEMDKELFQRCMDEFVKEEAEAKSKEEKRVAMWKHLEAATTQHD